MGLFYCFNALAFYPNDTTDTANGDSTVPHHVPYVPLINGILN